MNQIPEVNIISYGQCGEDVVIDRVFKGKTNGFYVDIGSGHPVIGSVTKNLADKGWKGIDIEPQKELAALLIAHRPNSRVICGAVAWKKGETTFHIKSDWALSSVKPENIDENTVSITIPCNTLNGYLEENNAPIGFELLKIDIEGLEEDVLKYFDFQKWCPKMIVIEVEHNKSIGNLIETNGYKKCLFDGVNEFFIREDLFELMPLASYGAIAKDKSISHFWLMYMRDDVKKSIVGNFPSVADKVYSEIDLIPATIEHVPILREMYEDSEVKENLYAVPYDMTEFAMYMLKPYRFVAINEKNEVVGTCAIEPHNATAVVGIVIGKEYRGRGYGKKILHHLESKAKDKSLRVLIADIYSSNQDAIRLFSKAGYNEFVWLEKNI